MEQLDYEIDQIERMQEIEQRLKEENGSYAMTRNQATRDAAEATKEVESTGGLQNEQSDKITDKIEITDMCAAGLHKPKMKGCDICYARRNSTPRMTERPRYSLGT